MLFAHLSRVQVDGQNRAKGNMLKIQGKPAIQTSRSSFAVFAFRVLPSVIEHW